MGFKLKSLVNEDFDQIFAYKTEASINLREREIVICYRVIEFIIVFYFLIIVRRKFCCSLLNYYF